MDDNRRRQLLMRKRELLLQKKAAMQQAAPSNKTNMLEAAALGAGQGASMGFGEEIGNLLGTPVAKVFLEARELVTGDEAPSWGELYSRGVEKSRKAMKTAREEHPIAYTGGEIGGAIGTGIYGATTKGGAALASRLGSGGLGARVLKGAGAGAASGGIYGFGSGEGSGAERLSDAGQGAVLGGATGGLLPVAGGAVRATAQAVVPKIDEAVKPLAKRAMDLGIPLRLDQISPTRARKTLQKVSQELPFSGAGDFEAKQLTAFNRGVAKTIGLDADNLSPESIQTFLDNAGNKFGVLTKGKQIKIQPKTIGLIDKTVRSASGNVRDDVVTLIQKNADAIKSELSAGTLNGSKLASIRSDIVKRLPNVDPQARAYVAEFVDAIDESVLPALSKDERLILQQARKEWRNFKTIEPLLEKSTDGMINPTELLNRVQASKYIKASRLKTGDDELVDLARIGKKFLPKAGGSDTFQKAALGAGGTGIVGTALVNPALGAALATKAAVGLGANRAFQSGYNTSQRLIGKALQEGLEPSFNKGAGALIGTSGALPNVIEGQSPTRIDVTRNPTIRPNVQLPAVDLPKVGPQSSFQQELQQYKAQLAPRGDLLQRIAMAESGGNPNARAKTSSASGLYQFTNGTWQDMVRKHGKKYGITMSQKNDPQAQTVMMQELLRENTEALTKALGRQPTNGELYIAHFAGAGGAKKLLRANQNVAAARVLPDAAKANKSIFYADGRPRTVAEVLTLLSNKVA